MVTGRMTSETGVITNNLPIRSDIPNIGQWLGERGYETVYAGKWHIPASYTSKIPGFRVIPTGIGGQGNIGDSAVSRACQGYLRNRRSSEPFLLVASFLQPHDICQYVSMHRNAPDNIPYSGLVDQLPELPENFDYDPHEPQKLRNFNRPSWSEQQWRYYIWSYYRHVEMVDAEIGRVLQELDDSGQTENTVIIFTSDHGEGLGHHHMVVKNYLYEEAEKVPLILSCPGRILEGVQDRTHLVSGLDIVPTICDYAEVRQPQRMLGRSLRPLLEGKSAEWHELVAAEVQKTGRMIRTQDYKYITYYGDPVEQLFDMENDPGETKNLAAESEYAAILEDHRKLLKEWEAQLDVADE
jgi:choline-sulfatase